MLFFLFGILLFVFIAVLAILTTVGLTLGSLITLIAAPGQLFQLLRNKPLRRNHALEHATVNVIEERYGRTNLSGLARLDGLIIRGGAPPALVADAAQEALERLRAGERRLAIHPRCGTTLVASQLVLAIAFIVTLILIQQLSLLPFLVGIVAAAMLGPRLSPLLQRFVTTDARVGDLEIAEVGLEPASNAQGFVVMMFMQPVVVRTEQGSGIAGGRREQVTLLTGDQEEIPVGDFRVRP